MDPFSFLGLPTTASREEVRRAYRQLAQQYHPDHNRDPRAPEVFKALHEAYLAALTAIDARTSEAIRQRPAEPTFFALAGRQYRRDANGQLWWWSEQRQRWQAISPGWMPTAGHVAGRGAGRLLRWWRS